MSRPKSIDHTRTYADGVIAAEPERQALFRRMENDGVKFLRLIFTDILGASKNVEVPASQFEKALRGEIMFDGSSIEGFSRIEESDMLLVPDLETYAVFPFQYDGAVRVGRIICDCYTASHEPFAGCPRLALKRTLRAYDALGLQPVCGPELEFFLFQLRENGDPSVVTHDRGGYFDLAPVDRGEAARRQMVLHLEGMGFEIEAAHHEVAPGQHEIDFKYAEALATADRVITFKQLVKKVAVDHGLHATFMPKPLAGVNGSGMHVHQSLFRRDGDQLVNVFHDPKAENELSDLMRWYIGGILKHAPAFVAITNPLVNSYKRLVPGYEAPVNIAWSDHNRSPLVRVPARRGSGTRCEVRVPDPSCNPYLAFLVMLQSGLDGIRNKLDPGPAVNLNIFHLNELEKQERGIKQLPGDLWASLQELRSDEILREALGEHIFDNYLRAKETTWREYAAQVHPWELERYLATY
ncbi:MAG TPA: type I glutamate--ammonia ligase [Candidatus Krumholzibacteria bacterium]|nr:type I glutamate--ammonia ligase [Candidatus Krumholzibacteria bacterium]HPD71754.1 type I glutamate--ammonia ligase [Candidatus Krumholzibacteria bacterium]HRY41313.1 type I glutamate--ammonia ligase [Candidatus Krumholzibacteria bacterium]